MEVFALRSCDFFEGKSKHTKHFRKPTKRFDIDQDNGVTPWSDIAEDDKNLGEHQLDAEPPPYSSLECRKGASNDGIVEFNGPFSGERHDWVLFLRNKAQGVGDDILIVHVVSILRETSPFGRERYLGLFVG